MNNFFSITPTDVGAVAAMLNIILSFVLQLGIAWVYKKTHRGLSYSPSFIFTLIIIGMLGTFLMMIVQQNFIGSVALLGAFSLIRFRTILKETRDVAFLFFALAGGVAIGTGSYAVGLVGIVLISVIILALDRYRIGSIASNNAGFILTFNAQAGIDMNAVKSMLLERTNAFSILQTRAHGNGVTFVFSLKLKDALDAADIAKELKKNASVLDVELVTGERNVEY